MGCVCLLVVCTEVMFSVCLQGTVSHVYAELNPKPDFLGNKTWKPLLPLYTVWSSQTDQGGQAWRCGCWWLEQLTRAAAHLWCQKSSYPQMILPYCGSSFVCLELSQSFPAAGRGRRNRRNTELGAAAGFSSSWRRLACLRIPASLLLALN